MTNKVYSYRCNQKVQTKARKKSDLLAVDDNLTLSDRIRKFLKDFIS